MGKESGEKETGSLALVWTLWFHCTYASRSEVAAGMPLALSFLWESLRRIAHKACLIAAFFFFFFCAQTINCVTVYSWALLHTEGCLYPYLETYRSNFYTGHFLLCFIESAEDPRGLTFTVGRVNGLLALHRRRRMKGFRTME